MNNCICCVCHVCGNEFFVGIPDLLNEKPSATIGEVVWCGECESHDYECHWGMFFVGYSSEEIRAVLFHWTEWTNAYRNKKTQIQNRGVDDHGKPN